MSCPENTTTGKRGNGFVVIIILYILLAIILGGTNRY